MGEDTIEPSAVTATSVADRGARGRFAKGNSLGQGRRSTRQSDLVAAAIEPHRDELIQRALVIAGADTDTAAVQAIKLLLERLAPAPKASEETVFVPGLVDEPSWEGKALAVVHAVASGQVSATAGRQLLGMISDFTRALSADRLEGKIAELERLIKGDIINTIPAVDDGHDLG